MKVSISLGGSLLTSRQDVENYFKYAEALKWLRDRDHQIVVVCGGGRPARHYIKQARVLGASPKIQDRVGILFTHLNALFLIASLGEYAGWCRCHPQQEQEDLSCLQI